MIYHIKRESFLKWMRVCRNAINAEVFHGGAPYSTIRVENLKGTGRDGEFIVSQRTLRGPITVHIVIGLHNSYFEDFDSLLWPIIIMAHEMLHEYCHIHNIKDVDPNGYHNDKFLGVAERHGMYCKQHDSKIGYSDVRLTANQVDQVISRIPREIWDMVTDSMTIVPHLPYQLRSFESSFNSEQRHQETDD